MKSLEVVFKLLLEAVVHSSLVMASMDRNGLSVLDEERNGADIWGTFKDTGEDTKYGSSTSEALH